MAYSIRRHDGRIFRGLSSSDIRQRCQLGHYWPDEEILDEASPQPQWRPLSASKQLADPLNEGAAVRAQASPLDPEQMTRKWGPAVLHIIAAEGSGTGFAIDFEGTIVTNNHVVGDTTVCRVRFHSGLEATAQVVLRSDRHDLAILRCALPTPDCIDINSARPDAARQGARAYVFGYPGLVETFSITEGLISAPNVLRGGGRWHQVSAPVNPGNSGGPVLGTRGELIGVTTERDSVHADGRQAHGIAWAIPYEEVRGFVRSFWSDVDEGRLTIPSAVDLMRGCNRPDPAKEIQLAVKRMVDRWDYRVVEIEHHPNGVFRMADLVGPDGNHVRMFYDPMMWNDNPNRPMYLYMYSAIGRIPEDPGQAAALRKALLKHNYMTPHWQFAETKEGTLMLRYCRQANLLDSSEVIHVVEDLDLALAYLIDD